MVVVWQLGKAGCDAVWQWHSRWLVGNLGLEILTAFIVWKLILSFLVGKNCYYCWIWSRVMMGVLWQVRGFVVAMAQVPRGCRGVAVAQQLRCCDRCGAMGVVMVVGCMWWWWCQHGSKAGTEMWHGLEEGACWCDNDLTRVV